MNLRPPSDMPRTLLALACSLATALIASSTFAITSAELYTGSSYEYGRFAARLRFGAGDGVVSSFFLWKDGSERAGTFWNELDFEKLGADCHLETNAFFGSPAAVHVQRHPELANICGEFHTYTYEWTPDHIAWLIDGVELRRETGATADAYATNATAGMQIRFNIWPGDASFGGNFSPSILPVYQQIDWVEYSSYADGAFSLEWRDDFDGEQLASRWLTGSWPSPKNLSTHDSRNVSVADGNAMLALVGDEVSGSGGTTSQGGAGNGGNAGSGGSGGGEGCSTVPGRSSVPNTPVAGLGLAAIAVLGRRRSRRPWDLS